jgi:hypothetical protein
MKIPCQGWPGQAYAHTITRQLGQAVATCGYRNYHAADLLEAFGPTQIWILLILSL